jgi:hypothetical protein
MQPKFVERKSGRLPLQRPAVLFRQTWRFANRTPRVPGSRNATGNENMDIDWRVPRGAVVKVRLFNDPKSFHPM